MTQCLLTLCYFQQQSKNNRSMRTSQLHNQDKNNSFTMTGSQKYETFKSISNKRTSTVKPLLVNPLMKNPNAALIAECGIQIDNPLVPIDVAVLRAERIAKEKMKHAVSIKIIISSFCMNYSFTYIFRFARTI